MKKLTLIMMVLISMLPALKAQEFIGITDIRDDVRGLKVSAVANFTSHSSFGAMVGYEIEPLTAYLELVCSAYNIDGRKYKAPSARFGMDYGFFKYEDLTIFTGAYLGITNYRTTFWKDTSNKYVKSGYTIKASENGFIVGLKVGAKYDIADRCFISAALFANTTNWNRSIGKVIGINARGALEAGISISAGWNF